MAQVLRHLPKVEDARALVGHETRDDAAVYQLSPTEAIVETVDFFTPVVDDPYWFGRIAAANAFSDVWAMGGRPLFALNLVGLPGEAAAPWRCSPRSSAAASEAAALAGAPILGGHSIDDPEPKYGMAVTGLVHPDRILRNVGRPARGPAPAHEAARLGHRHHRHQARHGHAGADRRAVTAVMAELNRAAGEVLAASGAVSALTDVTGFGLLGHAWEMAEGSRVVLHLDAAGVPVLAGVRRCSPSGTSCRAAARRTSTGSRRTCASTPDGSAAATQPSSPTPRRTAACSPRSGPTGSPRCCGCSPMQGWRRPTSARCAPRRPGAALEVAGRTPPMLARTSPAPSHPRRAARSPSPPRRPPAGAAAPPAFVVVLDPGHGGEKDGALSVEGAAEKDIALQIARLLAEAAREAGGAGGAHPGGRRHRWTLAAPGRHRQRRGGRPLRLHPPQLRARAAPARTARGIETYFLSADATDASASAVAARENADRLAGEPEPTRPTRWAASSRTWRTRPTWPRARASPTPSTARWCTAPGRRGPGREAGPLLRAGRRPHGGGAAGAGLRLPPGGGRRTSPGRPGRRRSPSAIAAGIAAWRAPAERARGRGARAAVAPAAVRQDPPRL